MKRYLRGLAPGPGLIFGVALAGASIASVQAQQPLARVVVGGMVTSPLAILFLLPVLASFFGSAKDEGHA